MVNNREGKKETTISGIWEDNYVRILGILDHCHEVVQLYNQIRIHKPINQPMLNTAKNLVDFPDIVKLFEIQLEKEMMDLYLILDKHFEDNIELKNNRLERFRFKEKSIK